MRDACWKCGRRLPDRFWRSNFNMLAMNLHTPLTFGAGIRSPEGSTPIKVYSGTGQRFFDINQPLSDFALFKVRVPFRQEQFVAGGHTLRGAAPVVALRLDRVS